MNFNLVSKYKPAGDQPSAIEHLVQKIMSDEKHQVLLGVTGSGKTFTIANVIEQVQKPTLVLTHNKTLVSQLYGEFKQFFPHNAVECFVSYYDYYQPEAYIPSLNKYIEKDLAVNEDLDRLRLSSVTQILSGRRDIIIVASVSCIYGAGNPVEFQKGIITIKTNDIIPRQQFLLRLVQALYSRTDKDLMRAQFKVVGDSISICLPYNGDVFRVSFFDDMIESIELIEASSNKRIRVENELSIFPANVYFSSPEHHKQVIYDIQDELQRQCEYLTKEGKVLEANRLKEKVNYDIEMIRELGYCSGIENYSRFFDRREPGTRPYCLIDYFPSDFLCVIDESHQSIPQIAGMYGGDRNRKMTLVEHGFRLPSALDNRPLNFFEFEKIVNQVIYVSATPGDYELEQTNGEIVEQVVRPTGLLDPPIEVRPSLNQIDDLLDEVSKRIKVNERVLVTTLTKKMAEELNDFLRNVNVKSMYVHSDVDTLERVEILRDLRLGKIDVLIGVNLLREGLDLPEVSLVAILDADKEGFLRNEKSLTQTAGRAARNENGLVIFYADKITMSMQKTIEETQRRRMKQLQYNQQHHIIPKTVLKDHTEILKQTSVVEIKTQKRKVAHYYPQEPQIKYAAEDPVEYKGKSIKDIEKEIEILNTQMYNASKNLDFIEAAAIRDKIKELKSMIGMK